jgi:hypothetical protein
MRIPNGLTVWITQNSPAGKSVIFDYSAVNGLCAADAITALVHNQEN